MMAFARQTRPVPSPSRDEIEQRLIGLLHGTVAPAEASKWAVRLFEVNPDPGPWNEATEDALSALAVADAMEAPDMFVYKAEDFAAWLQEFRTAWPKPD